MVTVDAALHGAFPPRVQTLPPAGGGGHGIPPSLRRCLRIPFQDLTVDPGTPSTVMPNCLSSFSVSTFTLALHQHVEKCSRSVSAPVSGALMS